jgi:hypothetical protein
VWSLTLDGQLGQRAWPAVLAHHDMGQYVLQYDGLESLRAALVAGNAIPAHAAARLIEVLTAWGAGAHGWPVPTLNAVAAFLGDPAIAQLVRHIRLNGPLQRIDEDGQVCRQGGAEPTRNEFWRLLRAAHLALFPHVSSPLYPAKVVLLLTGCAVAIDHHVGNALSALALPGVGHAAQLTLHANDWVDEEPPAAGPFLKLYALSVIAADFHARAVAAGVVLHPDPGRALDALLWFLDPGVQHALPANEVLHVHQHFGAWYAQ